MGKKSHDCPRELRELDRAIAAFNNYYDCSRVFSAMLDLFIGYHAYKPAIPGLQERYDEALKMLLPKRAIVNTFYNGLWGLHFEKVGAMDGNLTHLLLSEQCNPKKHMMIPDGSGTQWFDGLGMYYEFIASTYKQKRMGQFFTPRDVCNLNARLVIPDERQHETGLTCLEPACGSGRMILASDARSRGNIHVAVDLDYICCQMTVINMLMHGIEGEVNWCDYFAPDEFRFGWTVNTILNETGMGGVGVIKREESYFFHSHRDLAEASIARKKKLELQKQEQVRERYTPTTLRSKDRKPLPADVNIYNPVKHKAR